MELSVPDGTPVEVTTTEQWLASPTALESICVCLGNGGTLLAFARERGLRYSLLLGWLKTDPDRKASYEMAVEAKNEWVVEKICEELEAMGTLDLKAAFDPETGELYKIHEMPESITKAMSAISITEQRNGVKVTFKTWDKIKALELLGRKHGMFKNIFEVRKQGLDDMLEEAGRIPVQQRYGKENGDAGKQDGGDGDTKKADGQEGPRLLLGEAETHQAGDHGGGGADQAEQDPQPPDDGDPERPGGGQASGDESPLDRGDEAGGPL